MKKLICLLLCLCLITGMAGCASQNRSSGSDSLAAGDADNSGTDEQQAEKTVSGYLKEFSAKTLEGSRFGAEEFAKHDLTLINFWGTYCGPCIAEMPDLAAFESSLPDNIGLITFCTDGMDNPDGAKSIIDESFPQATVIIAADGDFNTIRNQIQYIPTTVFVDKTGNIVGSEIIGGVDSVEQTFSEHIRAALAEIGEE